MPALGKGGKAERRERRLLTSAYCRQQLHDTVNGEGRVARHLSWSCSGVQYMIGAYVYIRWTPKMRHTRLHLQAQLDQLEQRLQLVRLTDLCAPQLHGANCSLVCASR